jgi:hypothetical protein
MRLGILAACIGHERGAQWVGASCAPRVAIKIHLPVTDEGSVQYSFYREAIWRWCSRGVERRKHSVKGKVRLDRYH